MGGLCERQVKTLGSGVCVPFFFLPAQPVLLNITTYARGRSMVLVSLHVPSRFGGVKATEPAPAGFAAPQVRERERAVCKRHANVRNR